MLHRISKNLQGIANRFKAAGKTKYFCIGRNKTGTTSLKVAFMDLGYPVGDQEKAEILTHECYFNNNFDPIIKYCDSAQVFQDVPFSYPDTYKYLDAAFPNSKFILSTRDDAEQWYNSITRFHAKRFGLDGAIPTVVDLNKADHHQDKFMYNTVKVHKTPDNDPYNKEIMISHYNQYNEDVINYFKDRPDDLLVLNLAEPGAYLKFIKFLGCESERESFPWENRT